MASVSTYLNFNGQTEAAFTFYKGVFGTEFAGNGIMRMGDVPPSADDGPPASEAEKNLIMHVSLPILADHVLMGSDVPEQWGKTTIGTNTYISLNPDTREEADRLFAALSEGGKVESAMADQFWGDYWGAFADKFGVQWMVNVSAQQ